MTRLRRLTATPLVAALAGGLVVGLLFWVAIAAGWIEAADEDDPAAAPLAQPVADPGAGERALTVSEIYERTGGGVVHIEATGLAAPSAPTPFGPPGPRQTATGSGFVLDRDGHIVTNAHVVGGASDISVRVGDDEASHEASVVGADPSTDIAVIRIEAGAEALQPLALGSSTGLEVGDPVVAIGNPFGLDRTVTAGIVSALQREIRAPDGFTIRDVIQTDAPINPGNSGGPLLDASGEVVGVNSQIESQTGGNVGIGFAVPIDTVSEIAQGLIDDGEVEHAYLGITGADLTPQIADVVNLDVDSGALVQSVVPGSPAAEAGVRAGEATISVAGSRVRVGGDLILAVDGEPVSDMGAVIAAVDAKRPGDEVELTVLRGGEERDVTIELGQRPASTS